MVRGSIAHREQRTARRALVPLAVMAVMFVLPTTVTCGEYESPAEQVENLAAATWIVPVFAAAAVLALLTARALVRSEVSLRSRKAALAAVTLLAVSNLGTGLVTSYSAGVVLGIPACVTALLAVVVVQRARGRSPWRIWNHLLLAFAVAAAGAHQSTLLGLYAVVERSHLAPGAYVYLGALGVVLLVTLGGILQARPRPFGRG